MGYRLHYAKKYDVQYAESGFSHLQEPINNLLNKLTGGFKSFEGAIPEYAETFEVDKGALRDAIAILKVYPNEKLPKDLTSAGYNASGIAILLEEALQCSDSNNDYVVFSWY